jgi:hypothetical protein
MKKTARRNLKRRSGEGIRELLTTFLAIVLYATYLRLPNGLGN